METEDDPQPDDATTPTPVIEPPSPQADVPATSAPAGPNSGHRLDAAVLGAEPTVPSGEASERALAGIAQSIETPATLVWLRRRRGIDHRATLAADGTITLADGATFRDPSAAANAAQHTQDIDGWRVWRVGVGGPSLRDLLA
ncbi:MAG: oxidoreductase [Actinomyces ruminicola]|nr:oxidoreductase [Actinomyces ruminicola]